MAFLATGVVLSDDEDLLRYEPNLDEHWPRKDRNGNVKRDWSVQHKLAAEEIQRRFRLRRATAEPFQLGRVSERTRLELRPVATFLALHFIFVAADSQGDASGFFAKKADLYLAKASLLFDGVATTVDYDTDNDGKTDRDEEQQPYPMRVIRG